MLRHIFIISGPDAGYTWKNVENIMVNDAVLEYIY